MVVPGHVGIIPKFQMQGGGAGLQVRLGRIGTLGTALGQSFLQFWYLEMDQWRRCGILFWSRP